MKGPIKTWKAVLLCNHWLSLAKHLLPASSDTRAGGHEEAVRPASRESGVVSGRQRGGTAARNAAPAANLQDTQPKSLTVSDLGFPPTESNRQCSKVVRQAGCPGVPSLSAPAGWPRALG